MLSLLHTKECPHWVLVLVLAVLSFVCVCSPYYVLTSYFRFVHWHYVYCQCHFWRRERAGSLFEGGDGTQRHSARGARWNCRGKQDVLCNQLETLLLHTWMKACMHAICVHSFYFPDQRGKQDVQSRPFESMQLNTCMRCVYIYFCSL